MTCDVFDYADGDLCYIIYDIICSWVLDCSIFHFNVYLGIHVNTNSLFTIWYMYSFLYDAFNASDQVHDENFLMFLLKNKYHFL